MTVPRRQRGPAPRPGRTWSARCTEWCTENGFTPHRGAGGRQRPRPAGVREERRDRAQRRLRGDERAKLGNEFIVEFKARFGGVSRDICVPVTHVIAIYARERSGHGLPAPTAEDAAEATGESRPGRGWNRAPDARRRREGRGPGRQPSGPQPPAGPGVPGRIKDLRRGGDLYRTRDAGDSVGRAPAL